VRFAAGPAVVRAGAHDVHLDLCNAKGPRLVARLRERGIRHGRTETRREHFDSMLSNRCETGHAAARLAGRRSSTASAGRARHMSGRGPITY